MEPPHQIDGADVIAWAWSDIPFGVVPALERNATAIPIHGLALCRYPDSSTIYRFSCDHHWKTQHDADYESVAAAKDGLPIQYQNVPIQWHPMNGS